MNVHDSEKMAGILNSEGCVETDSLKDADIVILNTCSIRQKAEQKFYSQLGRIKSFKKKRPDLKIAVTGCIAQQEGKKMIRRVPYIDHVIGPQNIHIIKDIARSGTDILAVEDNPLIADMELPVFRKDDTKALVNIMYGCNNYCTYCIVPYTRGKEKSRASQSIINEIRGLADKGCKEVTLLGQNVNSYRSNLDFPELLNEINRIDQLERIRFVTSHPKDLSGDLISAVRDMDKVCEQIHLPLQSGSTKILGLMNRKYTYDEYLKKIEKLKKEIPKIAITSDIIAGFPQETDEDHISTVNALKEIGFDGVYAFKYSQRPGTKASKMDGQVPEKVRAERLSEILDLQNKITESKNKDLEGSIQEILIDREDEKNRTFLTGRTRTNKIVRVPYKDGVKAGNIIMVKIMKANRHSLEGEYSK